MAIGLFLNKAVDAKQHIRLARSIAKRMDRPLAILCVNNGETDADEEEIADDEVIFATDSSLLDTAVDAASEVFQDEPANSGWDIVEVPGRLADLSPWLDSSQTSEELGRFRITTIIVPISLDDSDDLVKDKHELFVRCKCRAVFVRQPVNEVSEFTEAQVLFNDRPGQLAARRLASQMRLDFVATDAESLVDGPCAIVGVSGADVRLDRNSTWNTTAGRAGVEVVVAVKAATVWWLRTSQSIDEWMERAFSEYRMKRDDRDRLAKALYGKTRLSVDFTLFMAIATMLASIGLVQNSTAVIIGAMLVAPLMTPLMAMGLALIHGNHPQFKEAFATVSTGVVLAFSVGLIVGGIAASLPSLFNVTFQLQSELIGRTSLSAFDPLIGLAAGMAGGFVVGRDRAISTLAGAAIAVALVPPIATAGLETVFVVSQPRDGRTWWDMVQLSEHIPHGPRGILIAWPLALFLINAFTVILGAYIGLRAVGMHRTRYARITRPWGMRTIASIILLHVLVALGILWYYARPA